VAADIAEPQAQVVEVPARVRLPAPLLRQANRQQHGHCDRRGDHIDKEDIFERRNAKQQPAQRGRDQQHDRLQAAPDAVHARQLSLRHELRQKRADAGRMHPAADRAHGGDREQQPDLAVAQQKHDGKRERGCRDARIGDCRQMLAVEPVGPDAAERGYEKRGQMAADDVDRHHFARLGRKRDMPHDGVLHERRAEQRDHLRCQKQSGVLLPV